MTPLAIEKNRGFRLRWRWLLAMAVGVVLTAYCTLVISDIKLGDPGADVTASAVRPEPGVIELRVPAHRPYAYIEFKAQGIDGHLGVVVSDGAGAVVTEANIVNGRTFVPVVEVIAAANAALGADAANAPQSSAAALGADASGQGMPAPEASVALRVVGIGDSVRIEAIRLFEGLPLRIRHVILYAAFCAAWCFAVVYVGRKSSVSVGQVANLKRYSFLLSNLVKKDFAVKYRRSVLGVLWSVLNPLLMMMVISAVFSNVFRVQAEHYPVMYLTGALVFNFMAEATQGSLSSVLGAGGLIKKVYIPKYIFPLEKCLFALINAFFSFVAALIVMPILGVSLKPTLLLFWAPLLYTLVFSIGLGMILAAANVFFRDVGHLYGVWVTAWMYITPILYPIDAVPDFVQSYIQYNPMYYFVDYFRRVVMYGELPDMRLNLICAAFALSFLALGLYMFKKLQDRFILHI